MQWADGPNGEDAGQVGSSVKVVVKYRYGLITPLVTKIAGGGFDVTACAVMRLERPLPSPSSVSGSGSCGPSATDTGAASGHHACGAPSAARC